MIKTYFEQQIKEKFAYQPTFQQEKALKLLSDYLFCREQEQICVLKGYAGTGKTSLVAALVKALVAMDQKVMLLAPTGRAAKVFSNYADHPAYTIHRRIYREKNVTGMDGEFALNYNKYPHTLFIVDEASMIANSGFSGGMFGSGRLLDDLISFVFQGEGCKLILLGDTAQLPPVGEENSPALSIDNLKRYGLQVMHTELTEVVRQSNSSGILCNATRIRQLILEHALIQPPTLLLKGFADICRMPGNELIEALNSSYYQAGEDETIVICRSNKRANIHNNGIRNMILDREDLLCSGDRVIIAKNNYFWTEKIKEMDFIANGDMAVVRRIRNVRELYGFNFADAILEFPDYDNLELEATILLNTLQSESPALTKEESEQLYNKVMEDYEDLPTKKERLTALRTDPYYNALQIKYAYAVTCHKSQGGQWAHVYLDQGYMPQEFLSPDYYHWLYTAFTRATEKLFLINWPEQQEVAHL